MGIGKSTPKDDRPLLEENSEMYREIMKKHASSDWYYNLDNKSSSITYIKGKTADVYSFGHPDYNSSEAYDFEPRESHLTFVRSFKFKDFFVGKDEELDGSYYNKEKYDGNTLLLKISHEKYVYISGDQIAEFKSLSKITDYWSPMGNNTVPYPFALDSSGNIYLMIDGVIISGMDLKDESFKSPYVEYWESLKSKDYETSERSGSGYSVQNIPEFKVLV